MLNRVNSIESVSRNGNGLEPVFKSRFVSTYVYPESKSAHDSKVGYSSRQIAHELLAELLASVGWVAGTYDREHVASEADIALAEEERGGIGHLPQELRV